MTPLSVLTAFPALSLAHNIFAACRRAFWGRSSAQENRLSVALRHCQLLILAAYFWYILDQYPALTIYLVRLAADADLYFGSSTRYLQGSKSALSLSRNAAHTEMGQFSATSTWNLKSRTVPTAAGRRPVHAIQASHVLLKPRPPKFQLFHRKSAGSTPEY